jgi:hypothetical protein
MNKIVLLELNEVPFRVIDHYCDSRPESTLAKILPKTRQYETVTEDQLALDPWISWPTFHRGVPDTEHRILHLGQVLDEVDQAYPPIWKILKGAGISVGVFGSLHSSAVPADADEYSFYMPDYFDNKLFAHPASLKPFQDLNLRMTRDSARNVSRKLPIASALKFAMTAPALGVSAGTMFSIAEHLAKETFNKDLRIRRRNYQPILSADLFLKQLSRAKPQFASFYSNHVAAAMHRYWGAAFPGDFAKGSLDQEWVSKYGAELIAAMDAFDHILKRTVNFVDQNPEYTLVLASSMGQAAIPAEHTYEFLTVTNLPRFMGKLGVPTGAWEARPAMIPCQCVVVSDEHRDRFVEALKGLSVNGNPMVGSVRPAAPMSFDERERGFFQIFIQFDHYAGDNLGVLHGTTTSFESMGLGKMAHEDGVNCTAQHVSEGSLMVYKGRNEGAGAGERKKISTLDFVPSVLAHFQVKSPEYLTGHSSISLS